MKNTDIDTPVAGLTVEDPNIGLFIVSLEALKDKYYEKHKYLTKRQLTDLMYELEVENTGLGVKLHLYEVLSAGWPTDPLAESFNEVKTTTP